MNRFVILLASALLITSTSVLADEVVTEAKNWREQAVKSLTYKGKSLSLNRQGGFSETKKTPLCVRLNNYGCVKQGNDPWNGSGGKRDSKGHAVFEDPAYSIRAVVRDYCSKHRRGLRSAIALADAYSPWCDTLGSLAVYKGWGRSCDDLPNPPDEFPGPFCKEPEGEPSDNQCASCNCPSRLAKLWLDGIDIDETSHGPYDDLALFDTQGAPNREVLSTMLQNKMQIELGGFEPTDELIAIGISLAGECR